MADLTTLTQVKALMGIADTTIDGKINALIPIVSVLAEKYCGRKFLTQTHTDEYIDSEGGKHIAFQNYPVTSITSLVEIANPTDTGTAVTSDQYMLDKQSGLLYAEGGWLEGNQRYKTTYVAGLGATVDDLPSDLTGAIAIWVSQAFQGQPDAIVSEEAGNDYAVHLLSARLPLAAVKDVLDLYRRPRI